MGGTGLYVPEQTNPTAGCWVDVSSGGVISLESNMHRSYKENANGPGLVGGYGWSIPVGTASGTYDIPGVTKGVITLPAIDCDREVEVWLGIIQNRMLVVSPDPGDANEVGVGMVYGMNFSAMAHSAK